MALAGTSLDEYASFKTVHNHISFDDNIIRKGAVSARSGEKLLIPLNMRDGSLISNIGETVEILTKSGRFTTSRLLNESLTRWALRVHTLACNPSLQ